MIPFIITALTIVIVIGGFILYGMGFSEGYNVGHDDGSEHDQWNRLPQMERWGCSEEGERILDEIKQSEWDREVNDRIAAKGGKS